MEFLSFKFMVSSFRVKFPATYDTTLGIGFKYSPSVICSKKSSYQDFQEYAKPLRLLPATKVEVCTDTSIEKTVGSLPSCRSKSLYKIKLQTSKIYGSGLTEINSGILICLIDENGSSILQRLPAVSNETDTFSDDDVMNDTMHFQMGSVDEFAFEGHNLGKIVAVWISLESGEWRIGGLSLTVFCDSLPSTAEENQERKQLHGFQYTFKFEDTLLGEKSDLSMVEFRPHSVTSFSGDRSTLFKDKYLPSLASYLPSNEASMKEYADLKFSLLFYDIVLILGGSTIAYFLTDENAIYAFLTGGFCGFFYLLFLQRSVDDLPAPVLIPGEKNKENLGSLFRGIRGQVLSLALALAFGVISMKYASGEDTIKFTAKDVMLGMTGFLMCKVSVVLAALKPLPLTLREKKQNL